MKQIDVTRLRIELFGEDRIPSDPFTVPDGVDLHDKLGNWICETSISVLPQHPRETGKRRNRIYVYCPCCGDFLPVGRLAQHYKIHETV